jgi:broad specificity phosphatase PhoE
VTRPGSDGPPDPAAAPAIAIPGGLVASLVLVRHGQSVWLAEGRFQGASDTPLSALGERQAALAGARLADPYAPPRLPVPAGDPLFIAYSPLMRTAQTAEAIAAAIAAAGRVPPPLVAEHGLREIAQGVWEGLHQRDVESGWPEVIAGWRLDPLTHYAPGGESLPEVDVRVREAVANILARLAAAAAAPAAGAASVAAIVAPSYYDPHAGSWAVLVGHDGAFKVAVLALLGLPLERFWSFTQAPSGIAVLDIRNGRAILRAWNRTEHLAALEIEAGEAVRLSEDEAAIRARSGAL